MKDNSIVYIDLSNKKITWEEISPEIRKKYIGGPGINTKILFDSNADKYDALSENNVLIFGVGPSVGTGLPASNRCTITAKSPITDLYGDSNVGGEFNLRMRAVGIDNLVFTGKAETPVYVHINKDGEIQILDAADIWGTWTEKVTDILVERHGKFSEVACIGPAGEKLVRFASVIMSKCHVAGRTGMGCVMGSKNLKAIVIEKKIGKPAMYDQNKIKEIRDIWIKSSRSSVMAKSGSIQGSLMLIKQYEKDRCIPIRNNQTGKDEKIKNIYVEKFLYKHETKRKACIYCPVGCAREYEISEGKHKGEKGDRLDYGAVAGVGACTGVFDWPGILHLKTLSDQLGLDAIEFGGAAGLILECQQRGILKKEDNGGKIFEFGNADDVEQIMLMIANREGVGDIAAEGTYRAAKKLNAEQYAFCIKKSSVGLHTNSHLAKSLSYLTSTRGGDHLKGYVFTSVVPGLFSEVVSKHVFKMAAEKNYAKPEKKGRVVWWHENYKYIVDALGFCIFFMQALPSKGVGFFQDFADVMNGLFNLDIKDEEVFNVGERIYQLQNAFNVNCGCRLDDYKWAERKKEENIEDQLIEETTIKVRDNPGMLPEYFKYRGLTKDGKPTNKRFLELELDEYIEKAKVIPSDDVKTIKDLLQDVQLNIKLTKGEQIKSNIINGLLCKLLDKKDKKDKEKALKLKEKQINK
ncbi:aldehyde ferredoxin oxidoreductase family protein [Clostridium sp. DJ247]|uniref:aldehyde ferredoxin oxidoreductase family protein n=1 Tax=Clostridium sp. DJ247 TaxID=2726188 RepID=UPI001F4D1740|nr:aldehyde ferredoxin oxidoreductase family protein [Clostridium sp. DJ247]